MRALLFGVVALLAGCPLSGTHSSTVGGGGAPTSNTQDATPSGEDHHRFLTEDFAALVGLTVEQATAKAKQLGHTGDISVHEEREFVAGCKAGTVCEATNKMGDTMQMSFEEPLLLSVNPTVTIAAPPPD